MSIRHPLRLVSLIFCLGLLTTSTFAWSWSGQIDSDVIVTTDFSESAKNLELATPETPVLYRGKSYGNTFGSIPGDREPVEEKLLVFATRLLRKQGYHGAPKGQEPTLFLTIQWGLIANQPQQALAFLGYDARKDIGATVNPTMLGPEVFLRNMRSYETTLLLEMAKEPIYGIIITAFDYKSVREENPVALWQTRIGCSARGQYLEEALPRMLALAGPQIGHPTGSPILIDGADKAKTQILLGELQVISIGDESK